jgi:LytS/YehU family sensor histidine kinase
MELRISRILPILISISIPGIGFFLSEVETIGAIPMIYQWMFTSLVLYFLWQLLAFSWRFKPLYKQLVFLVVCIPIILIIVSFFAYSMGIKDDFNFELKVLIRILFLTFIFMTIQYGIESQKQIDKLKIDKEQLSKENYKAQLQSLRSQMDPHFLFNTLNTLRSMVRKKHDKSEEFILSLSDFYRSTLKHYEENTLLLSEELSLLNSYLNLMKSRNEKAVQIDISGIERKYSSYRLPSFSLQNVVENCFKHNSMSSNKPLRIKIITLSSDHIEVSNNIQEKLTQTSTTGTGLKLLKKRYKLLGENKGVNISKFDDIFQVKLKLINPANEYFNS